MTETVLTESTKEAVDDAIAAALGDAYDCNRVWEAWSYGTMGPDDFSLVAEDSDHLSEISNAAIQAVLASPEVQALRLDAERWRAIRALFIGVEYDEPSKGMALFTCHIPQYAYRSSNPDRIADAAMKEQKP